MKKLFWIIFLIIIISIFNINAEASIDYSYLKETPQEQSIISINVKMNLKDLVDLLKDREIDLISVKPIEPYYNESIITRGNDIYNQLDYAIEIFTDKLINKGYGEKAMYYKVNGFSIDKIKVFGKNENIYKLVEDLHR